MPKQALIAIDIQQSFAQRPYWDDADAPAFLRAVQATADACRERGIAIAQVFHESGTDDPANPFSRASGRVRTLPGLDIAPDGVFHKTVHSSLYARDGQGETLQAWLERAGIEEVILCGIRTEQCCETTARHASDAGYAVRYLLDATLTFAMRDANGRRHGPDEIKTHTAMVLQGRFAQVQTVEQWLRES